MSNVINFEEKKWEKEFNSDMQEAFNNVVEVLTTHLSPEVGVVVGSAIAASLREVSDGILDTLGIEQEEKTDKGSTPFS